MRESSQSRLPPQALQFSSQSPPLLLLHRHITKYYHDLFSIRSYRRFLSDIKLANCDQVNIYQLTLQILTRSQSANLCYQHGAPNVSCSEIAFIMLRHNQCCIYPAQKYSNRLLYPTFQAAFLQRAQKHSNRLLYPTCSVSRYSKMICK